MTDLEHERWEQEYNLIKHKKLCNKCFSEYDRNIKKCCNCNNNLIEVEYGIHDIILLMWAKGISTCFSCAGVHYTINDEIVEPPKFVNFKPKSAWVTTIVNNNHLSEIINIIKIQKYKNIGLEITIDYNNKIDKNLILFKSLSKEKIHFMPIDISIYTEEIKLFHKQMFDLFSRIELEV